MSVTHNLPEFSKALYVFAKNIDVELKKAIRRIALDLQNRVIEKTPVSSGFARASWNISVNKADETVPVEETIKRNKAKGTKISEHRGKRGRSTLADFNPYSDTIYINNSAPYILDLESGRSVQAPAGMLLVSLAEIEAEIESGLL